MTNRTDLNDAFCGPEPTRMSKFNHPGIATSEVPELKVVEPIMTDRTTALEQALKDIRADILRVAEAHYACTSLTDPQSPAAAALLASLYTQMTDLCTRIDGKISEALKHE